MSDKTDRRAILKAVAALPLALTYAPAEAYKLLAPTKNRKGRLIAKLDQARFDQPGSIVSFQSSDLNRVSESPQELTVTGHAIKLPNGEITAYAGVCADKGCRLELRDHGAHKEAASLSLVCYEHDSTTPIAYTGELIKAAVVTNDGSPHQLRVKHCHNKVCIIDDRA